MEKKNTWLIVLIVVLSLCILGLGGYIIYDKFIAKNDIDNQKISELDLYNICSKEEQKSTCTRTLTIGNNNVEVTAVAFSDDGEYYNFSKLKIDGNIIYSKEANISYIKSFEDLIILETYCINCGGNSAEIPTVVILDKTGNIPFDIYIIAFENGFEYDYKINNFYEIKNNKIVVTASRVGYFADYGPYPSADCYFENEYVNGNNYSQVALEIAKIEYEIEYLGNNKFATPKKIKEIKFNELYSKEHCMQEFEEYERISKELEEE